MGNMIGILSTVILVSTLATLIFAVGAYIVARRRRDAAIAVAEEDVEPSASPAPPLPPPGSRPEPPKHGPATPAAPTATAPDEETPRRPPPARPQPEPGEPLFRRLTIHGDTPATPASEKPETPDRETHWE